VGTEPARRVQGDQAGAVRSVAVLAVSLLTTGCALRSDVVRLETQLIEARRAQARSDSLQTANLAAIARGLQSLYDTLAAQSAELTGLRGEMRGELYNVQQQLVAIQELTGQSQQRLSDLRRDLDQRAGQGGTLPAPGQPAGSAAAPDTSGPGVAELLELSVQQLRRGSPGTARAGLVELLRRFPTDARAADAEYFIGEAWAAEQRPDSAAAAYRRVTQRHATSPRAASSWYKLGLIALAAGRTEEARTAFTRVTTQFASSAEAALARERLRSLPRGR
jgi:TolA-binding protein